MLMAGGKKVTFSQVVDQMASSLSRSTSSSLSDLATDDIKLSVTPSWTMNHSRRSRRMLRRMGSNNNKRKNVNSGGGGAHNYNSVNSGSEASMESLEMSSSLHPRTLSVFPQAGGGGGRQADHRHIQRMPSADSLLAAIRNRAMTSTSPAAAAVVLSTPASPQHSEDGIHVLPATPLASSESLHPDEGVTGETRVEIHNHPYDDSDSSPSAAPATNTGSGGGLSLDVPGFHFGQSLSPIEELPSPLPTPAPSPLPQRTSYASSRDPSPAGATAPSPTFSKRLNFRNRFRRNKSCTAMAAASAAASAAAAPKSDSLTLSLDSQPTPIMRRRSVTGDGTYFEETSFIVPTSVPGGRSSHEPPRKMIPPKCSRPTRPPLVPTITLTVHDSDEEPERSEVNAADDKGSAISTGIVIPQVYVTTDGGRDCRDQVNGLNDPSITSTPTDNAQSCELNSSTRFKVFSKNETKDTLSTPKSKIKLKETKSRNSEPEPPPPSSVGRSGRQETLGKSKSLGARRCSLSRQEVVVEEEDQDEYQDEVKHLPKPFDSAPRSRSQSVDCRSPEFRVAQPHPKIVLIHSEMAEPPEDNKCCRITDEQKEIPKSPAFSPAKADGDSWIGIRLGSPPLQKAPVTIPSPPKSGGIFMRGASPMKVMAATVAASDKSNSLDLPCITVTPISEIESDSEATTGTACSSSSSSSAAAAAAAIAVAGPQMHYLSPFTHIVDHRRSSASSSSGVSTGGGGSVTGGHGSRTTSESNLSSSGYSSMTSPSTSRNGSSNPLCTSESEEVMTPTKPIEGFFVTVTRPAGPTQGSAVFMRRPRQMLKSPSVESESSDPTHPSTQVAQRRTQQLQSLHEKANALRCRYGIQIQIQGRFCTFEEGTRSPETILLASTEQTPRPRTTNASPRV